MPTFEEFVQVELPKRPFTNTDGAPGQVLLRSNNPLAVRELIWGDLPGVVSNPTYTSAVDLSGHRLVVLNSVRHAEYADNQTLDHAHRVLGLTVTAALTGSEVEVVSEGEIQEPSWSWTPGAAIYLGSDGNLIESAPVSPALFSLCVGFATATDRIVLTVGTPIILG